jgi:hypothetical protein
MPPFFRVSGLRIATTAVAALAIIVTSGCGPGNAVLTPQRTPASTPTPPGTSGPSAAPTGATPTPRPSATPTAVASPSPTPSPTTTARPATAIWSIGGTALAGNSGFGGPCSGSSSCIVEYHESALLAGNVTAVPFIARAQRVNALAFDSAGDLWASEGAYGQGAGDIVEFSAASLAAATAQSPPAPALTIAETVAPLGLTFDTRGNLWVAVGTNIDEYAGTPSSASATPIVQLTGAGDATALAFAPDGTLWYTRGTAQGVSADGVESQTAVGPDDIPLYTLYGLSPAQLAQSGSPVPAATLAVTGASIPNGTGQTDINIATDSFPFEIAFDASGNLWTQSYQNLPCVGQGACGTSVNPGGTLDELIDFPATSLHSSGAAVTWTSGTFSNPGGSTIATNTAPFGGVAFDTSGNLYEVTAVGTASNLPSFTLQIYASSALQSATPQPSQSLPFPAGYITTGPTYR